MRIYKFRGKDKDGKWVYGDLLHILGGSVIYHGSQTESDLVEDRPNVGIELYMDEISSVYTYTVSQFTGLYDINGKEIYEGDILSFGDDKIEVRYVRGVFAFLRNGDLDDELIIHSPTHEWAKIIGNIYEKENGNS